MRTFRANLLRALVAAGLAFAFCLRSVPLPQPSFFPPAVGQTPVWAAATQTPVLEAPTRNRSSPFSNPAAWRKVDRLVGFLAGGFLATRLWARFFGFPANLSWAEGGLPVGLLDLVALSVLAYLGLRLVKRWQPGEEELLRRRLLLFKPVDAATPALAVQPQAEPGLAAIAHAAPEFDLAAFGEDARRLIASLYNAWNRQELDALTGLVAPQTLDYLRLGQKVLNLREEVSRLEDLHLQSLEVIAAGREGGRDSITLRLTGQVTDFILHRLHHRLLSGSLTTPAQISEDWRFERLAGEKTWRLHSIEES